MKRRLARAKINLALHVTGRRDDGFHLLDSLVCFADVGDFITVFDDKQVKLDVTGPKAAEVPQGSDNLVLRAARLLGTTAGARILLEKHLPVAAGIGGGSADAAIALQLLAEHWKAEMPPLSEIAALGADVPVCLANKAARLRGIGDRVDVISHMPAFDGVLVNPGKPLSTARVFRDAQTTIGPALEAIPQSKDCGDWIEYLCRQRNDLEGAAIEIVPEIRPVLDVINASKGCRLARMSGSGATCFGLFQSAALAYETAQDIKRSRPDWWVRPVRLD